MVISFLMILPLSACYLVIGMTTDLLYLISLVDLMSLISVQTCQKPRIISVILGKQLQPQPTIIHSETAQSVVHFQHLGMVTDSKLKFCEKCDISFQKGQ